MSSSDASSTSPTQSNRRLRRSAVLVALVLLGSSVLVRTVSAVDPAFAAGTLAILAVLAAVVLLGTSGSPTTTDDDDSDDEGGGKDGSDVWNAIPPWQYEGRHVESGGLARGEQERALQDIQRQADELSEEPSRE